MKIPLNEISTPGLLRLLRDVPQSWRLGTARPQCSMCMPRGLWKLCACRPRTMQIFA